MGVVYEFTSSVALDIMPLVDIADAGLIANRNDTMEAKLIIFFFDHIKESDDFI